MEAYKLLKNKKLNMTLSILGMVIAIALAYSVLVFLNKDESKLQKTSANAEAPAQGLMYEDLGDFIASNHTFYNETLGWGRDRKVSWPKQREQADLIVNSLKKISAENKDLQTDLGTITSLAETVQSGTEEKDVLIKLHRYFHDLDIGFNDYKDTTDYFDVTEYKGES
jgi:cell division protein FtsI/penicillin-binding protein 2